MTIPLKMMNLPWTYTRQELARFLSQTLNTRVKFAKILYDKQTGLSRGVAFVQFVNERTARDVVRRGTLEVDGRTVLVTRGEDGPRATTTQESQQA